MDGASLACRRAMHAARRRELIVPAALLAELVIETYRSFPLETGGILLGQSNGETMTLSVVIGPGPSATHGRFSFDPDQRWQVAEVAAAWRGSSGPLEYLGDWHTHPNGRPHPSKLDIEALRTIREAADARVARPIMLIVGARRSGVIHPRAHELGGRGRGYREVCVMVG